MDRAIYLQECPVLLDKAASYILYIKTAVYDARNLIELLTFKYTCAPDIRRSCRKNRNFCTASRSSFFFLPNLIMPRLGVLCRSSTMFLRDLWPHNSICKLQICHTAGCTRLMFDALSNTFFGGFYSVSCKCWFSCRNARITCRLIRLSSIFNFVSVRR